MISKKIKQNNSGDKGVFTFMPSAKSDEEQNDILDFPPAEMSIMEKQVMEQLLPPSPPLPFATRPMKMAYGPDTLEYIIPDDVKESVLHELYPFEDCPSLDDILFDIHQRRFFRVANFRVIRERKRNMLVAPDYPNSGGMVVDWMETSEIKELCNGESQ